MERGWSNNKAMGWIDDKVWVKADNNDGFDVDDKSLVYMAKGWNDDKVELPCIAEIQLDNTQELDDDYDDKVVEQRTCGKETGQGIDDNWAHYDKMKTGSICGKKVLELTSRFCMEFLVCDDELVLQ